MSTTHNNSAGDSSGKSNSTLKYLSEIIQEEQTALFDRLGVFFAFGNKQFDEQKKEGVEYVSMGAGMICPKKNVQSFIDGHSELVKNGRKKDIELHGIDRVIAREISNHESFYTMDKEPAKEALIGYGITDEQFNKVWTIQFNRAVEEDQI